MQPGTNPTTKPTAKLWGGRFQKSTDPVFEAYGRSLQSDRRLARYDLSVCAAHVSMLAEGGTLTHQDAETILSALQELRDELPPELDTPDGRLEGPDEDIHSWVERRLKGKIGPLASAIRLGRSRNDLVVTDFRLYVKDACRQLEQAIKRLQASLLRHAEEVEQTYLPGYTHLQRAQPVLLAHHLLAHFWALQRDVKRFQQAADQADCCVLGAGALAGSSWPIDPQHTARELGFDRVFDNSLDGVSDRDFALEFLFACSVCAVHLSRMSEELVLWSATEFSFVRLDDAWSTGSSLMPQKKNPDPAELVRGRTGHFIGNLVDLLTNLKALPLAYNRDLQHDKPPVFSSFEELLKALDVMNGAWGTLKFQQEAMELAASDPGLLITDLADGLVRRGLTFDQAHELAGRSMACPPELSDEEAALVTAIQETLTPLGVLQERSHQGAAGPASVERQLEKAKALLSGSV